MNELRVSDHAIAQFRAQSRNPNHADLSDEQIVSRINAWWAIGIVQTEAQFDWAHKFKKYGAENSEHRKAAGCVMTRVDNTIVTVHFKSLQERRRDKKRRLKKNQRKRTR